MIPGINLALDGVDFVVTGEFSIASIPLGNKRIGTAPDGIKSGQNNDYLIECKTCNDIKEEQENYLQKLCSKKVNKLKSYNCNCPDTKDKTSCGCTKDESNQKIVCEKIKIPKMEPCISLLWGDSECDCMETTDYEVACITICNYYKNVSFEDFRINKIIITDENGRPVETLPNGNISVEVLPSGPICFGDIPPCSNDNPSWKSRELVIKTVGAKSGKYQLALQGVCYETRFDHHKDYCFDLKLCGD